MISLFSSKLNASYEKLAFDFSFKDLDGSVMKLADFKDKVIVVTNVASYCGFTSQYEDLQEIWEKYQSKGLCLLILLIKKWKLIKKLKISVKLNLE